MKRRFAIALLATTAIALTACNKTGSQSSLDKELDAYQASAAAADAVALKANQDFLAATARQPGVISLPSGLMYKVLSSPDPKAPQPTASDTVTVNYEGSLVNGHVFDSSYARGQPATFPLGRVIEAWQVGIPLMHKGDTYMLYVPSALGYGAQGMGADIPPDSVLVFKVQLLDIGGKTPPEPQPVN